MELGIDDIKTTMLDKVTKGQSIVKRTEVLLRGTPALRSRNEKSKKESWNQVEG